MACMSTQERPAWPHRDKKGLLGHTGEACMATQEPRMACMATQGPRMACMVTQARPRAPAQKTKGLGMGPGPRVPKGVRAGPKGPRGFRIYGPKGPMGIHVVPIAALVSPLGFRVTPASGY